MRKGILTFRYFAKGEYVRTPEGVGIVAKDEEEAATVEDLHWNDVNIQHKSGCSNNPSNFPKDVERWIVSRIEKTEYDEE